MLINIKPPISGEQSRALLAFCRSVGATVFTANFVFVEGEESELLMKQFYEPLGRFAAGDRVLEKIYGSGFAKQECWFFNDESIELIVSESQGDLFSYDLPNLPEDWLFYVEDAILLQVVTHEQEATLRVTELQYEAFKRLNIAHGQGCPKWTGLPEQPIRATSPR